MSRLEESANANTPSLDKQFRVVFHVDMDSFYASCEISLKPELRDVPFVVGADPKEGKGRGVVIACNYPARKFGIRSAMPISKAWELCPNAIFVPPNFRFYGEVSNKVFARIRDFADKVEQVSIDEAYLDVTDRISLMAGKTEFDESVIRGLANSIKNAVRNSQSITCSIGVSDSKIVAKIATDVNKPDGLTIVSPESVRDFLAPLPVGRIPGVGKVTESILSSEFNVKTISDLRKLPEEKLEKRFGKTGSWLLSVSNGREVSEVTERWDPVSLSGETTFDEDEGDYSSVSKMMFEVARDVQKRCAKDNYLFSNVGIKVRFTGFETHTRSRSLRAPTDSIEILNGECERLLSEFFSSGKKVRLIGVRVSGLEKSSTGQSSLLEWKG